MNNLKILPIELTKYFEINKLKKQFFDYGEFEILNPEDFDILDFYPDLLVKYLNDIFLIHFIDEYTDKNKLFFLSTLSLAFKKNYQKKYKGNVIIIFYVKNQLTKEQSELIILAEKSFDMRGEIDVRDLEELKNIENYPNYLEHKIWPKYYKFYSLEEKL
jgi:hypothetical protein